MENYNLDTYNYMIDYVENIKQYTRYDVKLDNDMKEMLKIKAIDADFLENQKSYEELRVDSEGCILLSLVDNSNNQRDFIDSFNKGEYNE